MERAKYIAANKWMFLLYGILVATIVLLGIRYSTYSPPAHTHYHANFAVYINGEREQFKDNHYYEEVQLCDMHDHVVPPARAHMHDHSSGTIHVHDDAVTWGQFFENIGWYVGPDFIRTPDHMYRADDANKLHIILNGDDVTGLQTITNEVIGDKDRLLVSFGGADSAALQSEYKTVPSDAAKVDAEKDPAACGGEEAVTPKERMRHLF